MSFLVTGAAGFIGFHAAKALLERGDAVIGIDNLNAYYDVELKKARLALLEGFRNFTFHRLDIADRGAMEGFANANKGIERVLHLAAQAGVRYSLVNPHAYVEANVSGHLNVLELCRRLDRLSHLVYASTSSVYGGNVKLPFAVEDRVDRPVSFYAATKRCGELMSFTYSRLYGLAATGLRFFTVYGPWGRPDMAAYLFTRAILDGETIRVFNHGDMKRDFTYIDDITEGVIACLDQAPTGDGDDPPHRLYNIGNHRSEPLLRFIEVIEKAAGRQAKTELVPMQPGEVEETCADITAIQKDIGFNPSTTIDAGIPKFVDWYKDYHGVS